MSARKPDPLNLPAEQFQTELECGKLLILLMALVNHKHNRPTDDGAIFNRALAAVSNAQLYCIVTGYKVEHSKEFNEAFKFLEEVEEKLELCPCPECTARRENVSKAE